MLGLLFVEHRYIDSIAAIYADLAVLLTIPIPDNLFLHLLYAQSTVFHFTVATTRLLAVGNALHCANFSSVL